MAKKKILWIEDDNDLINSVRLYLEKENWDLDVRNEAAHCVSAARESHPDLILMDIILDNEHGYSLIEDIKNQKALKRIPILVYSSYTSRWGETTATREDGLLSEAEEYIDKSSDPGDLITAIKKYI